MKQSDPLGWATYEEAERNRKDPQWGKPVETLALLASHMIESAEFLHPELWDWFGELERELWEIRGYQSRTTDYAGYHGIFTKTESVGEIVVAVEAITRIMRAVAPYVEDSSRCV